MLPAKNNADSKKMLWTGRVLSGLAILFLLVDSVMKILRAEVSVETTVQLGYSAELVPVIGLLLLICTVIYIIPRTSILGAILLTGYLGGAVATNLRAETPLFSHVLFPVYVGLFVWGGLYFQDKIIRKLIPLKK